MISGGSVTPILTVTRCPACRFTLNLHRHNPNDQICLELQAERDYKNGQHR